MSSCVASCTTATNDRDTDTDSHTQSTRNFLADVYTKKEYCKTYKDLPYDIKIAIRNMSDVKEEKVKNNMICFSGTINISGYSIKVDYEAEDSLDYEITFHGHPLIIFKFLSYKPVKKVKMVEYLDSDSADDEDRDALGKKVFHY